MSSCVHVLRTWIECCFLRAVVRSGDETSSQERFEMPTIKTRGPARRVAYFLVAAAVVAVVLWFVLVTPLGRPLGTD